MIYLKNKKEIELMRVSGRIAAEILANLVKITKSGIQTIEIEKLSQKLIDKYKVVSAFKNYNGYPYNTCISINEEIVHGLPSRRIIHDTDIVSIDFGIKYKGYNSDCATTIAMDRVKKEEIKLINVTKDALINSISVIKNHQKFDQIALNIMKIAKKNNLSIAENLTGHGIGKELQEDPQVLNKIEKKSNLEMRNGMVFCIEPMLTLGNGKIKILKDGWTIITEDHKKSAHFEHTIALTEKGPEILTKT